MSVEAISWAYRAPVEASADRFLLVTLANFADEWGVAFPGQDTLCRLTGLGERRVRAGLAALEAAGLIRRVPRRRQDGTRRSDVVVLTGFEGRRRAVRPDDHDVVDLVAVDSSLEDAGPVGEAQDVASAGSGDTINRQDVPVDVPAPFTDQPAPRAGCTTGTNRPTNRHHVPVAIIRKDTKLYPEERACAREAAENPGEGGDGALEGPSGCAGGSDGAPGSRGKAAKPAGDPSGLVRRICEALGNPALAGRHWWKIEADFGRHIEAWREAGLSDDEIVAEARAFGRRMPEPPEGPKALDGAMRKAARRRSRRPEPAAVGVPEGVRDAVDLFGRAIAAGQHVAPSAVTPTQAREIVERGYASEQDLRARGIAF